jgi:hypothetical protein
MSNSLADLLADRNFDEPPEMLAIKKYVHDTFDSEVEIQIREREIIITSSSAALANSLRLKTNELRAVADTTKRLVFRIR